MVSVGNKRDKKKGLAHNDKIEYSVYVCSQHHCIQKIKVLFFLIFVVINFVMRSLYFTVVKKRRRRRRFCAFNKSKKKEENYCDIRHLCTKKLAKRVYMYILSQHYHFDRQWKELEKLNASFEGRTTHLSSDV